MEDRGVEGMPLTGDGIESPNDLAAQARTWLNMSQGDLANRLHMSESTISRYETGQLRISAGYLAYLVCMVVDAVEQGQQQEQEQEQGQEGQEGREGREGQEDRGHFTAGSHNTRNFDEYRRRVLRLTNRMLAHTMVRGSRATTTARSWDDLRQKAGDYAGTRQRSSISGAVRSGSTRTDLEPAAEASHEAGSHTALGAEDRQSTGVGLDAAEHAPQAAQPGRAVMLPAEAQTVSVPTQVSQVSPASPGMSGEPEAGKLFSLVSAMSRRLVLAISLLVVTVVLSAAGFFLPKNLGLEESAGANSLVRPLPTGTGTVEPGAGREPGSSFESSPGSKSVTTPATSTAFVPFSRSRADSELRATPRADASNDALPASPGMLSSELNAPEQGAGPAATATTWFAPTMTPSAVPTRVPVPSRTPTLPVERRTGAVCSDGVFSCSTGSGTCSRHGGVSRWTYYPEYPASCP